MNLHEYQGRALFVAAGIPMPDGGTVAVHQDITAHLHTEQQLDETRQFLDSIIENIPMAIVVKDAVTRKFVLVNRAFETMLKVGRNEVLGKTVFEIYQRHDAERMDASDSETLGGTAGRCSNDYEIEMPGGQTRVLATTRIVARDAVGAARHLVAAAALRPQDADLRVEAGRALLTVDRYDEAEVEFRVALELDLWAVPAWQGLGEALAGQRRWADAEEVYRGGLRLAPESAAMHELLGDVLLASGRFKEALVWYRRASALDGADSVELGRKIERAQAQIEP